MNRHTITISRGDVVLFQGVLTGEGDARALFFLEKNGNREDLEYPMRVHINEEEPPAQTETLEAELKRKIGHHVKEIDRKLKGPSKERQRQLENYVLAASQIYSTQAEWESLSEGLAEWCRVATEVRNANVLQKRKILIPEFPDAKGV